MKTLLSSKLSVFFAGTTLALMFAFGIQSFGGAGKFHDSIAGVGKGLLPKALAGFNSNTPNIYDLYANYANWTHSTTLKADDTTVQTINLMKMSTPDASQSVILNDINGDGLVDIVYDATSTTSSTRTSYYGVFLNNGNLGSVWTYKCVVTSGITVPITYTYYGDCAG